MATNLEPTKSVLYAPDVFLWHQLIPSESEFMYLEKCYSKNFTWEDILFLSSKYSSNMAVWKIAAIASGNETKMLKCVFSIVHNAPHSTSRHFLYSFQWKHLLGYLRKNKIVIRQLVAKHTVCKNQNQNALCTLS